MYACVSGHARSLHELFHRETVCYLHLFKVDVKFKGRLRDLGLINIVTIDLLKPLKFIRIERVSSKI